MVSIIVCNKYIFCCFLIYFVKQDEKKVQEFSKKLGVKSYKLFANMLTTKYSFFWYFNNKFRPLEHFNTEMGHKKLSPEDLKRVQLEAYRQAPEITDILQTVPPELLLLLKTK